MDVVATDSVGGVSASGLDDRVVRLVKECDLLKRDPRSVRVMQLIYRIEEILSSCKWVSANFVYVSESCLIDRHVH